MQPDSNSYSSLLLPSFVQKRGSVKVFVVGTNNPVLSTASRMTVEHCISELSNERDAALNVHIETKWMNCIQKTKLHCEMTELMFEFLEEQYS